MPRSDSPPNSQWDSNGSERGMKFDLAISSTVFANALEESIFDGDFGDFVELI